MKYLFEEEFIRDHPETIGESNKHFDLAKYVEWLENKLIEARN